MLEKQIWNHKFHQFWFTNFGQYSGLFGLYGLEGQTNGITRIINPSWLKLGEKIMKIQLFSLSGLWRDLQKFLWPFSVAWQIRGHIYTLWAAKSKKVMYSITFVIFPCSKNDSKCIRPFSCLKTAFKGRKINIDSLAWPSATWGYQTFNCPAFKGRFQAGKRPNTLEIVSATPKITNEWSKVLFFWHLYDLFSF